MKLFTKAVLVSAMAVSTSAMALQSMDDESLSAATGQDGITVTIDTTGIDIAALYLHDNDGLDQTLALGAVNLGGTGDATTTSSGAITINNLTISKSATATDPLIVADIDADAGAGGTQPFLNIGVKLAATDISIDSIGVASSNAAPTITSASTARRGVTNETAIISNLSLSMGATALNIQLGNQPQGALIVADANIIGGINVTGLTLTDNVGGGDIVVGSTWIKDAGGVDLGASAQISVEPTGLKLTTAGTAKDIYVQSLSLGTAQSIGSIEINGLDLNTTTMTVRGH